MDRVLNILQSLYQEYTTTTIVASTIIAIGTTTLLLTYNKKAAPKKDTWQSHLQPHGKLQEISSDLWMITGFVHHNVARNMTIWRLPNKKLLIHSCVVVDEPTMQEILKLGEPAIVIVPSGMHRMDIVVWKERFPNCTVICPKRIEASVSQVIQVEGYCEDVLPQYGIQVHKPEGIRFGEYSYEIPLLNGNKALIVTDLMFNIPPEHGGRIARLFGSETDGIQPTFTRLTRYCGITDKSKFIQYMKELASKEYEVLVVAHGSVVKGDVSKKILKAVEKL